jgi:predicted Zn-dependent peptidase
MAAILAAGGAMMTAQVPRPAQPAAPKPAPAATPKPPTPERAAKPAQRETAPSYSVGLPQVPPPLAKLPASPVERLPNGMGVVLVRNPNLPLVDVALILATGYSHDPAGKRGLTRAVAYSIRFGGTLSKTEKEVEAFLVDRSLTFQVSISPELTQWSFRCRKEDLPDALGLLAEMFTRPAFRRAAIEGVWQQMRFAIQTRSQNLEEAASQEVEAAWFGPDSPWTRRYEYADVQALDRESVVAHFEKWMGPSRGVIGLSGDVDPDTARQLLGRTIGGWTGAKTDSVTPSPLPIPARQLIAIDSPNASSARLLAAVPLKQRGSQRTASESAVLALLAAQLDLERESNLATIMTPFRSDGQSRTIPGLGLAEVPLMRIIVPLRPREAIDGTVALWKELQALGTGKITAPKLESVKRSVLQNFVFQTTTAAARFQLLMEAKALGIPPHYLESVQQAVLSMTPAEYERHVKEQVNLNAAQLVLIGDERDYRSPPETTGFPVVRASTAPPPAPTAKEADETSRAEAIRLLAEVQKAMGGAEVLAGIRDATWDYEAKLVRSSPPILVTQHNSWLSPGMYRQEQTSSVATGVSYYDGKVGWSHNGRNLNSLTPALSLQYRNEVIRLLFRLVRAGEQEGYKVAYAGSGLLKITSPENYQVELAIDSQTNLPERLRFIELRPSDNAPIPVDELLSDYKPVDGVLMPHRIIVKQLGQEFADFTMKQMRFNTGLTVEQIGRKP